MDDTTTALLEPQIETEELTVYPPEEKESLLRRLIIDSVKSVVVTFVIFLFLITYIVQGFRVYGSCMEPNLKTGERLLGNKFIYHFKEPQHGDVIIFRYPKDPSKIYIKRIIATAGETVFIRDGKVFINNKPLYEPYLVNVPHGSYGPETVHPGHYFVMGDYRDFSNDSRYWGQLPANDVTAKAWVRYWPMKRLHVVK